MSPLPTDPAHGHCTSGIAILNIFLKVFLNKILKKMHANLSVWTKNVLLTKITAMFKSILSNVQKYKFRMSFSANGLFNAVYSTKNHTVVYLPWKA